jgi:hypothetical protein
MYKFHKGIDYAANLGDPFNPVADGTITYLNTGGTNEWYISVDTPGTASFQYLHIFNDCCQGKAAKDLPADPDNNTIYGGCEGITKGVCTSGTVTLDFFGEAY